MRIGSNYNSNILLSLTTSLKQISNNQPGSSGEMKLPDSISDQRANISIIISNSNPEPSTIKTHFSRNKIEGPKPSIFLSEMHCNSLKIFLGSAGLHWSGLNMCVDNNSIRIMSSNNTPQLLTN